MGRKNNAGFQPLPKMLPHNAPYISNPEDRGERLQAAKARKRQAHNIMQAATKKSRTKER